MPLKNSSQSRGHLFVLQVDLQWHEDVMQFEILNAVASLNIPQHFHVCSRVSLNFELCEATLAAYSPINGGTLSCAKNVLSLQAIAAMNSAKLISRFDGSGDVDAWLCRAELIVKAKKEAIPVCLDGAAFAVYEQMPAARRADFTRIRASWLERLM